MNDSICPECGDDNMTDLPVCPSCAVVVHFPHRFCVCAECRSQREQAERFAEPALQLVRPDYMTEIRRVYADDAILLPDMLGELEVAA